MKKITSILALCAMIFVSCAKDDASELRPANPDQINFRSNTTRATSIDLAGLQSSNKGFVVYAASGANPSGWFAGIDGTVNYKYSTNWGWASGNPQWPTTTAGYPMKFYAYFATSYSDLTLNTPTPTSMTGTYVIQSEANQVDFLAATSTAVSKPASGVLPLTFNHILSKVNFGVIPGYGASVYVQALNVNNVGNTRNFNFLTTSWVAQPTAFTTAYIYKATTNPALQLTGIDATEVAALGVAPNHNNLMLMPQTATTWTPGPTVANAYIGVMYRMQTAIDDNAVGYKLANYHSAYHLLQDGEKSALNNKPLFVKVGYPFASGSMTWDQGKAYTYNICLGTANATNGYLLSNVYYDENGNPTSLLVIGKNTGDPVTNGTINFLIHVTDWVPQTPSTIQ